MHPPALAELRGENKPNPAWKSADHPPAQAVRRVVAWM
jgi:hypothetical protein